MHVKTIIRLIPILILCLSGGIAYSQTQVPNEFQAGEPAKASEVNANFDALESAANSNSQKADDNAASVSAVADSLADATLNIAALASSVSGSGNAPDYKFVGLTSSPIASGGGRYSLLAHCQAEFGANARIARSSEVYDSVVIPATDYDYAWLDSLGSSDNCFYWTNTQMSEALLLFTVTGRVTSNWGAYPDTAHCAGSYPVACSIPW